MEQKYKTCTDIHFQTYEFEWIYRNDDLAVVENANGNELDTLRKSLF